MDSTKEILQQLRGKKVKQSYEQIRNQSKAEHGFKSQGSQTRPVDTKGVPLRGKRPGTNALQTPRRRPQRKRQLVLLVDFLVRLYRGAFQRVYVFSPSVFIDSAWKPVFKYVPGRGQRTGTMGLR